MVVGRTLHTQQCLVSVLLVRAQPDVMWQLGGVERRASAHPLSPVSSTDRKLVGQEFFLGVLFEHLRAGSNAPAIKQLRASDRSRVIFSPSVHFVPRCQRYDAVSLVESQLRPAQGEVARHEVQCKSSTRRVEVSKELVAPSEPSPLLSARQRAEEGPAGAVRQRWNPPAACRSVARSGASLCPDRSIASKIPSSPQKPIPCRGVHVRIRCRRWHRRKSA